MRRLICTFVVRIWHKTHFRMTWLNCVWNVVKDSKPLSEYLYQFICQYTPATPTRVGLMCRAL